MARWQRLAVSAGCLAVVVLLAVTLWYELEAHALGPPGHRVVLDVHQGEPFDTVLADLGAKGVVGSTLAFRLGDVLHGTPAVEPGFYAVRQNSTFGVVRAILSEGPNIFAVDVDPGITVREVAAQVEQIPGHQNGSFALDAVNGAVRSPFEATGSNNLEGLIGTGTYLVEPGETDAALLRQMVARFDQQAARAGLTAAGAAAVGMTPYQVVTIASIVEKEGYIPKNMPDVARVIYNRLALGMALQMDSTVLYALGQDGGPVTPQDEQRQTPYNTYLNTGLTPTPICSPSEDALRAAVHPPAGQWLYFELVSKDGTLAFSDTYAGQLANENLAKQRGIG